MSSPYGAALDLTLYPSPPFTAITESEIVSQCDEADTVMWYKIDETHYRVDGLFPWHSSLVQNSREWLEVKGKLAGGNGGGSPGLPPTFVADVVAADLDVEGVDETVEETIGGVFASGTGKATLIVNPLKSQLGVASPRRVELWKIQASSDVHVYSDAALTSEMTSWPIVLSQGQLTKVYYVTSSSGSGSLRDIEFEARSFPLDTGGYASDRVKLTAIEVELEQIDNNSPLSPNNRICSNAQMSYRDVQYRIDISPSQGYSVKAILSGTAGVAFDDGTSLKECLVDGSVVVIKAQENSIGTYVLTAECEQNATVNDVEGDLVFRFAKKEIYAANSPNISEDYVHIITSDGVTNFYYKPSYYSNGLKNIDLCNSSSMNFSTIAEDFPWLNMIGADFTVSILGEFGVITEPEGLFVGQVTGDLTCTWETAVTATDHSTAVYHLLIKVGATHIDETSSYLSPAPSPDTKVEEDVLFNCGRMDGSIGTPSNQNHACAQRVIGWGPQRATVIGSCEIEIDSYEIVL